MSRRERMERARDYSRRVRLRRISVALWVLACVLAAALTALAVLTAVGCRMARQSPQASPRTVTAVVALPEGEPAEPLSGVFTITGYCACCTPYSHLNRCGDLVLTASGEWVHPGEAVAVDPDIIPLGSTVTIGEKTYRALDTGVHGYVMDVLMDHEDAAAAGAVRALVTWEVPE